MARLDSLWLSAATAGYRGLLAAREELYRWGVLQSRRLPCPVISIGNLTLGGTGKTPAVELAVRTLQESGVPPAVVSRGYARRSVGVRVVADRTGLRARPEEAGDEPFLLARRLPGVPVVVGENRYEAGRRCLESFDVRALVLDDAFQHRTLEKDLEIVLVAGVSPWGNGHLFPRGPLREPLSALERAHLVTVTNAGTDGVAAVAETVRRYNPRVPIVAAEYVPVECFEVADPRPLAGRHAPEALKGRRLLAFAGIARPEGFKRTLERLGVALTGLVEFPDHYWYRDEDLARVARQADSSGAEGLITTEKDYVRLSAGALGTLPIWVLTVRLAITEGRARWREAFQGVLGR
jgi:tetraacyldisaccharide 4'-kinase